MMYNISVAPFGSKYLTSYLMAITMFAVFQCLFVKISTKKFYLENLGSGHGVYTTFEMDQFDGKYQPL